MKILTENRADQSEALQKQLDAAKNDLEILQVKYKMDMAEQTARNEKLLSQLKTSKLSELQKSLNKFDTQTQEIRDSLHQEDFIENTEEDEGMMDEDDFSALYTDEIPEQMKYCKMVKYQNTIWWLIESDLGDLVWWRSDQLEEAGHIVPE